MSEVDWEPLEECRVIPRGSSYAQVKAERSQRLRELLEEAEEGEEDAEERDQ